MKNVHFLMLLVSVVSACGICENEVSNTVVSPNDKYKAVVFNRNCGATTGFNTQVSIISKSQVLPNGEGNVFIMDDKAKLILDWQSDKKLIITGNFNSEIFKQNREHQSVQVVYKNTAL